MMLAALIPAGLAALAGVMALALDAWDIRGGAVITVVVGSLAAGVVTVVAGPMPGDYRGAIGAVVALLAACSLAGGWRRMTEAAHGGQTAALGAFTLAASLLAIAATDLLTLALALEVMALAAYALVALAGTDRAHEAATKYFVQGAVATGLLVLALGVSFARGGGSLAYDVVMVGGGDAFPRSVALLGLALLVCVFAFKAGAFPFHSWAPDAYETAEPPVAALLASAPKVAVIAAMVFLFLPPSASGELSGTAALQGVFALLALASIVFGNLGALRQRSLTRMLAYSGIAQVGYALVGIAAGAGPSTLLFAGLYGLGAAGAFLVAEAVHEGDPAWDGSIGGLAGLSRTRPVLSAALAALMLSLTGIPLLGGFVGKLAVFAGAAGSLTWLVVAGVVGSVVSFGYYGSVIRAAYLSDAGEREAPAAVRPGPAAVVGIGLAVAAVALGALPIVNGMRWLGVLLGR
jgi:NADH-quinone oxidoreductase subunit N